MHSVAEFFVKAKALHKHHKFVQMQLSPCANYLAVFENLFAESCLIAFFILFFASFTPLLYHFSSFLSRIFYEHAAKRKFVKRIGNIRFKKENF